MAQSILTLIIRTVKEGGGDRDTIKSLVGIKGSLIDLGIVAGAVTGVVAGVDAVFGATVGKFVDYAKGVDTFSEAIGISTEEAGRMIQVGNLLGITEQQLQTYMFRAVKEGIDPSIAGLAELADKYNSLGTAQEKALFLTNYFGKGASDMARLLAQGGQAIKDEAAAVQASLAPDKEKIDEAFDYEIQLNKLNQTWTALKLNAGEEALPLVIKLITEIGDTQDVAGNYQKIQQSLAATATSYNDYENAARAAYDALSTQQKGELALHVWDWQLKLTEAQYENVKATQAQEQEAAVMDATSQHLTRDFGTSASALSALNYDTEDAITYTNAYSAAIKNGADDAGAYAAGQDAVAAAQEKVAAAADKARIDFETSFTAATVGAEQTKDSMDYLGKQLESLGSQGDLVWEGFLATTGQISPAAAKQFVQIESDYEKVKEMLAAGIAVDVVVNWLLNQTSAEAAFQTPQTSNYYGTSGAASVPGTGGKIKLASWASAADIAYAEAHPDIYDLSSIPGKASGADFIVPPGYSNDSYLMRVQSGEHVVVKPAGSENNTNNYYNSVMEQYSASPMSHIMGGPGGAEGLDIIVPPGYLNDSYPVRAQSGEHVMVTPAGGGFDTGALERLIITLINQIQQQRNEIQRLPTLFAAELMKLVK